MLRTNLVRRAGRLLGAVTATGVLSITLLAASPAAAQAGSQLSAANGVNSVQHHVDHGVHTLDANGI